MVDKRISGATSGATNMAKKYPIRADGLTDKQQIFVKIFTENEGRLTPTECARQAGYSEGSANVTSSQLLNGKRYPKVVEAIIKKRAEIEKTLIVLLLMLSACVGKPQGCTLTAKKSGQEVLILCPVKTF